LETITLSIDGREVVTRAGRSVLEVALEAGIYIPHLCYHPDLPAVDNCKLCVVEIAGMAGLPIACTTPAVDGMVVSTGTGPVNASRQRAMTEILASHPPDCGTCVKYLNCELQSLKQYFSTDDLDIPYRPKLLPVDASNPLFDIDPNKCVLCGRCIRACRDLRGVGILDFRQAGVQTVIGTAGGLSLAESGCRFCGACAEVCPTGAILDKAGLTAGRSRKAALVPCRYTCPAEIDVPGYLRCVRAGDYAAAYALILDRVPFPGVLGYICDHPCEAACRRGELNQPLATRELKRHICGQVGGTPAEAPPENPSTGRRVAVVGSGPAGLTAAYYLSLKGHAVTVFEAMPLAGGMLRYGIPAYRLPRDVLDEEIARIEKTGVKIKTGVRIDSIAGLLEDGFDAVLIAVGTHRGQRLPIPGADSPTALVGVDFLRGVNAGEGTGVGEKVVVLGGGSVASDCARVARRLGAVQVQIACLESRENLPAAPEEVLEGEEEGIIIHPSTNFTAILTDGGNITGVECLRVASFSFDDDGRPQVETVPDSRFVLEADTVIFAVGQRPDVPPGFEVDLSARGVIELDPFTLSAGRKGIFAAGDAVSGTASVIKAIASGRKTAAAVDRSLGGDGETGAKPAAAAVPGNNIGRRDGFAGLERRAAARAAPEERLKSFCPVEASLAEDAALAEAERCLQCDLRLEIGRVKIWSEYLPAGEPLEKGT
jgi:formate dehydrogenase beta subunit